MLHIETIIEVKILGECIVGNLSTITIEGALLVKGVKNNLLSIIQLCDKGYTMKVVKLITST